MNVAVNQMENLFGGLSTSSGNILENSALQIAEIFSHDKLIQEIWIIRESLCISHCSFTGNEFGMDPQLMSGFISALISFSGTNDSELKNIDFNDSRLTVFKNKQFTLVSRSSSNKPIARIIQISKNIAQELNFLIENDNYWSKLFLTDAISLTPTNTIQNELETIIRVFFNELSEKNEILVKIDLFYFITMISHLYFSFKVTIQKTLMLDNSLDLINTELLDIIIQPTFNEDILENTSYKTLFFNLMKYFNAIIRQFIQEIEFLSRKRKNLLQQSLIKFLNNNWRFITHFGILDPVVEPLLSLVYFTND